jgi:paraquat-inducible protein B
MSDPVTPPLPHAATRRSRRISVIWLIPIVAVAIGAWLAWDTFSKEGPTIKITFEGGEGLQAGQSQLKYKDIVFGTVKKLELTPDKFHVVVTIATTRASEPLLTDHAVFWVVKPRLFAGSISGLDTVLSGSYVGMVPGNPGGKERREFTGQEDPPILVAHEPGHTFLLKSRRIGSITLGSPVYYRDLDVGQVLGWDISDMAESVTIRVFVRAPYDAYVHDESRFWNASGISVDFGSEGLKVRMESLRTLLFGGIAFDTPLEKAHTEKTVENHLFSLFPDREAAAGASYTREIRVVSYFPGSVGGLAPGADVTMHGIKVGEVTDVRLAYDAAKEAIVAPVHFLVQPERIVGVGSRVFKNDREAVEALLKKGLRASLKSASLITGQQVVALDFVATAPAIEVTMEDDDFVLPTTEGGGFAGLASSASDLLNKVNTIPFEQIGANLDGILRAVNDTAQGPEMRKALTDLAGTIAAAEALVQHLDTGVSPVARRLPELATSLQTTVTNANKLLMSLDAGYGNDTKFNRDLDRLMLQLNDATRSVRALADLLARHPEALIKGRPGGGVE